MALPVNIDTTYDDDAGDASVKDHQQHHDALHTFYNQYEGHKPVIAATSAPANPEVDQLWYDTINNVLKRWTNTDWVFESQEIAHVEKSDANFSTTSTFSNQTGGALVTGLSFQVDTDQQLTIMAKACMIGSGVSPTALEFGVVWLEHVLPNASVVKGIANWHPISGYNGTGWTSVNMMYQPQDRFVLAVGINTIRVRVARFDTNATFNVISNAPALGSRSYVRAERMS